MQWFKTHKANNQTFQKRLTRVIERFKIFWCRLYKQKNKKKKIVFKHTKFPFK